MKKINLLLSLLLLTAISFIAGAQPQGANDPTFTPGAGANQYVAAIAIQSSDGKIIIGGAFTSYNGTARNRVARLNTDGTLDGTFNPGSGVNQDVSAIAVQSDGKIIIGGNFTSYNGTTANRIARLNANGTLDETFTIGTGANFAIQSIALQSDGKIVIGGHFTSYNGTAINRVARLNTNGTLDTSFTPGAAANQVISAIAIQNDGKIVVGGDFTSYDGTAINRVARLNTNGTLDASFTPGTGADLYISKIVKQSDGKIIIGGNFTTYNGTSRNRIARLNTNGTLDATFNPGPGANGVVWTIETQSDGKIIIGGNFTTYNGYFRNRLIRMTSTGSVDGSFNSGGTDSFIFASAVSNGKIILAGDFTSYDGALRNRVAQTLISCSVSSASSTPTVCINTAITNITHSTTGATAIGTVRGLPTGVTANWASNVITISGTPTVSGTFNYTIPLTFGCGTTTATGTIVVSPTPTQPSVIIGSNSVATGSSNQYSVTATSGVTYAWDPGTGGTVTGSGNMVNISWSSAGTKTIQVTKTDACGTSVPRTLSVTVTSCVAPAQPSIITKDAGTECINSTASYSVTNVSGVTYLWAVSTGGTIVGSGNSANVTWNATTGARTVTVTPSNGCGNGTARTLSVAVSAIPNQPSVITGAATLCTGVSTSYSVTNVAGVTYTWDTSGAGTISGTGNAINVTWNSAGAKTLTVTPSNACGNGVARSLPVAVNANPSQPSIIAGANAVQTGSASQYSVTPETGITYAWSSPGGTITGSGNSVNISWAAAGSKTITVTPSNSCGNGTVRTLPVTVSDCAIPSQPSTVSGSATACIGSGSTYFVTSVGGVNYNWDAGSGGSVVGTGNSVTLSWSTSGSKTITVTPFNACGNGAIRTFSVTVSGAPTQPSAITGTTTACKDAAATYSVTNVPGVTYTWDTGGRGTVSGSGNSVNVTWTNTGTQTLVVTPGTSCGNGPSRTLSVTVNKTPDPVSEITGSLSGCVNSAIPYSVTNVSGVTYTWSGGANSSASNATNSPTITWTTAGSKTITVTPSNSCGNGTAATKSITVTPATSSAGSITGSATPTQGVSQTYSVSNVSGTTYTWEAGSGATIVGVGNSVQISWSSTGAKTVSVTPANSCGSATASTLGVTVGSAPCAPLGAPSMVSGSNNLTTGGTALYTAATVSGATSYTFSVSPTTGTTIANTGNANEKTVQFTVAGTYVVSAAAVNACGGTSAPVTMTVIACDAPVLQPTGLTATGVACIGKKQRYSVTVVDGFTYQWSATNGTVTNVSNGIVDITWANAATGQVSVSAVNVCGSSSVAINAPSETLIGNPYSPTITNNLVGAFCDTKVVTWTISDPEAGVTYDWVSDRPATASATAITATINGPLNIKLYGNNACATNFHLGGITGTPFPVPTTAPGVISGTLNPITGQIVDYTIPNESSPFRVRWNYGSGASDYPIGSTSFQTLFGTTGNKTLTVQYVSDVSCNIAGPSRTLEVVAVAPCTVPSPPSAVTRLHSGNICKDVAYAFSVPNIAGVTYNWSAGADATITGSGNEVLIKWSTNGSKDIIASYTNACGTSGTQQTTIGITPPPSSLAITGDDIVCNGAMSSFSVASVGGVTYTWESPGATLVGQGNNNITINNWPNTGTNIVKFKPSNACGFGPETSISVTVNAIPAQPTEIAGDLELCLNSAKTYSVTNVPGVTYAWNLDANAVATGTGNSRTISWPTIGSKNIQVIPSNACGSGPSRQLYPDVISVPAQPSAIVGTSAVTIGGTNAYSVTQVNGVNYAWSLSDKGSLSNSGNSASVFWNTSGSATVSVTPSNVCGGGAVRTQSITISKIAQSISFTVISPVLTTEDVALNGTTSAGLPVSYASSNTSVAEINGDQLLIKSSGTINLTATQVGDNTFASASPVVRSLTINKTNQIITFETITSKTFGDGSFTLEAESNSTLPITYASSNTSVATVTDNEVAIIGAGSATITATQGGDVIYNAATPVERVLTVNKADQSISFDPLSAKGINDPPFILTATTSSALDVTYSSSNTSVATVSGNTVTLVGEGTTTITASQVGNTNYLAATPVDQTLEVNGKEAQTITFAPLSSKTFGDADFSLSATASSSLAVSYVSSNTSVATVSGSTVSIVGVGSTTITASQSGDATFNPANTVQQILVVNKADQSINFSALENKLLSSGSFELAASASSGFTVTYTSSNTDVATISGTTVTLVSAGTTTITAAQEGNENYNAATPVEQALTVTDKQAQSINFNALLAKTFGDATVELGASTSSGLTVSYESSNTSVATVSGGTLTIVGAGSTTIIATQSGNDEFEAAAPVEQVLVVNKANQVITFTLPATANFSDGSINLVATSNAGLPISFASSNAATASVEGNTLTLVAGGTVEITASQSGNSNVNAAGSVTASITIVDDRPTIVLSGSLDFGDVLQDETAERTLTIANTGNGELKVTTIALPVGFTASVSAITVAAQSSASVIITFAPTEIKKYNGSIMIISNAPDGAKEIPVTGSGTTITGFNEPGHPAGELDVYPNPGKGLYVLKGKMNSGKLVSITDLSGRSQERRLLSLDEETHQLDITDMPQGVYYIKVEEKGSIAVKRIVKLN